ncbi:hypothetical protein CH371_08530 [Leptospira wolffii]|uniref:Uncharacterized protein n=1 Tax=Leptospira wolffii TaxID=409998 RepID=A0A2M9ZD10_9LEPT|nr:hypothetical protein [Leptospira wolffii]PJZ66315.1 hypothetical protein CH371_08530 [Leptospira wolffii]
MLVLLFFLIFLLILLPASIVLDVWQYSKAGQTGFPLFWSLFFFLGIFCISPNVSRFSSLAERWRKFWRFTAGIYEGFFLILSGVFFYLAQKETQLYKIAPEKFGEKDLWLLFSIYLGPFVFVFISSLALWIYDFWKKENGNYVKTRERTILYLVVSGCILFLSAVQLHLRFTNPDFGGYQKTPETTQYPFYLAYTFLIYEWIRNRKSEGGKNGAMLFFACLIFSGVFFVLFPNILLAGLASIVLFAPVWAGRKRRTEFSVFTFAFTVGVFLSRFITWRPEIFTKLEYYRFDHHISLLLLLLFGNEIRKSIAEWPDSKKETIAKQILFYYRILVFAAFAVWASFYEFEEGVYTSQFGLLHVVSLHLVFLIAGYLLPALWRSKKEIFSDPKVWTSNFSESVPAGIFLISLTAFYFSGVREISVGPSIFVGSQAQDIKNLLGPPAMENATTLKYYKVKTDNSPGVDPEKSREYLLEFKISNSRYCSEIPPGTVEYAMLRLRTGYLTAPYGWFQSARLNWFQVKGLDRTNISTEQLAILLTELNVPIYTSSEDTNPTLGNSMYFNLPGKSKGEIVPISFRYKKAFDEVALDHVYFGDNEFSSCRINRTNRGVLNTFFDPVSLSKAEWIQSKEYLVTQNAPAYTKPEETASKSFIFLKGMVIPLQLRTKEKSTLAGKTGYWFYYKGVWIFDSALKEKGQISQEDYAELTEEDFERNGISFNQWSRDVQESCSDRGKRYEPKSGSLLWSLEDRFVTLKTILRTDDQGHSNFGFLDFDNLQAEQIHSVPEEFRDFAIAIRNARITGDAAPFYVKVRGRLSLTSSCLITDNSDGSYERDTSVWFRADSSDFISPKKNLVNFGSFKSFKKEFFLYFDNPDSAARYCSDIGLSLARKEELERIYSQKDKFQLPMDSDYASQYWQADQAVETGASGSFLKAVCVKR